MTQVAIKVVWEGISAEENFKQVRELNCTSRVAVYRRGLKAALVLFIEILQRIGGLAPPKPSKYSPSPWYIIRIWPGSSNGFCLAPERERL